MLDVILFCKGVKPVGAFYMVNIFYLFGASLLPGAPEVNLFPYS